MAVIDPSTLQTIETPAMHIPDGFVSGPVAGAGFALAGVAIGFAVWRASRTLGERFVPLMGVMAAFIFAAQMMNFPVAGGTSGHLVGGALAAILLGPWAAMIVMTSVVGVQALVFQDGGLAALGANVFNMAVVACLVGYVVYTGLNRLSHLAPWVRYAAVFAAAWFAVEVAAIACSIQLALSDTSPLSVALPAMVGVHAAIGVGEGLITVAAVAFVSATRPDLLLVQVPVMED
ncbi:MAG: energy-coupling factor ABC transporter permease [Dehalococcoidia bacterium]